MNNSVNESINVSVEESIISSEANNSHVYSRELEKVK